MVPGRQRCSGAEHFDGRLPSTVLMLHDIFNEERVMFFEVRSEAMIC